MAASKGERVCPITSRFSEIFATPENFAEPQNSKFDDLKLITKQLYDRAYTSKFLTELQTQSLPKLLTDGFDEEQIWQQIDLQNKSALTHFNNFISLLDAESLGFSSNSGKNFESVSNDIPEQSSDEEEQYAFDGDSDSSADLSPTAKAAELAFDGDSDSSADLSHTAKAAELAFEDDSGSSVKFPEAVNSNKEWPNDHEESVKFTKKQKKRKKLSYKSVVDDQFFKLSNLEEFLRLEDLKEERDLEETSDDDEEDDIDLFQDIPEDMMLGESVNLSGKSEFDDLMYEDFFDAPDSGDESLDETDKITDQKKNDLPEDESVHEMDQSEDNFENAVQSSQNEDLEDDKSGSYQKTAFELQQEKVKRNIQEYEQSLLKPLPWHLTGEVAASSRPANSLVKKDLEYDTNVKEDVVYDNALNEKIESIIINAIMNQAYNDVERKTKPTEEETAYKKELVIDQKKSKKGLAEVYEEDYLNKQKKETEEVDPKHKEIKKLMDELFPQLQALFTHIPKPAIPEITIVNNMPAITVEEVAPTSVSDVALLAPEEVKKKSGLIKGKTERTDTDRKRERRKKKLFQKFKQKKKEAEIKSEKPTSRKAKILAKEETLKKLKRNRNTKIAAMDADNKIKSSTDFFSRLQDTVQINSTTDKKHANNFSKKKSKKK